MTESTTATATGAADLVTLPKAELHLHIEGTLEPELVFELARRNQVSLPFESVEALRAQHEFEDLQSFLNLYYDCMAVLQTREDFEELGLAYLRRAARDGVRHAEIFFDPQAHTTRGVDINDVIDGLLDALRIAGEESGMTGGLILCVLRDSPVDEALATIESIADRAGDLVGVGLDSAEVGYPPSLFVTVFDRARELGLHVVAHAGEEGPAEYVWEALDLLKVERIDHGIRSLDDDLLVERLRESAMPLTVCPLSNIRLGATTHMAAHPLPQMLEQGLVVTINSDDPAYFGGYVGENFAQLRDTFALSAAQLARLAQNSITGSFASAERKQELLDDVQAWLATAGAGEDN
ncbi:adenosine deaminase [Leifsonia sp. A12D58]|uniref:adenosine deaminase n=1 Tax=Leifsonia sp. A12D58 TaxID=3397674 RepID=UPI0039E18E2F